MYFKKPVLLKTLFIGFLTFGLLVSLNSSTLAGWGTDKEIKKNFDVSYGGTLLIDSDLGSVDIKSHSAEEVRVTVHMRADTRNERKAEDWFNEFELTMEKNGRDVEIIGEREDGLFGRWRQRIKVHFDIIVPEEYNLDVKTAGGKIEVADIKGEVELRTSGGGIRMGEIDGDVKAATSGGGISLERANGNALVKTSGGRITLGEVKGDVEARTSGGGIDAEGVDGDLYASSSGGGLNLRGITGNLRASTSGGSIKAELLGQIDERVEVKTSGGGIRLDVPDDLKADLNASTSGGHVSTDLPITIQGKMHRSSLHGKLNGGGPELYLRTSGGSITIR